MSHLAVTVLGHDRPGLIATAAAALAGCGMNLEDSSMTLLRGNFAMTLVCSGEAPVPQVEAALNESLAHARRLGLPVRVESAASFDHDRGTSTIASRAAYGWRLLRLAHGLLTTR